MCLVLAPNFPTTAPQLERSRSLARAVSGTLRRDPPHMGAPASDAGNRRRHRHRPLGERACGRRTRTKQSPKLLFERVPTLLALRCARSRKAVANLMPPPRLYAQARPGGGTDGLRTGGVQAHKREREQPLDDGGMLLPEREKTEATKTICTVCVRQPSASRLN